MNEWFDCFKWFLSSLSSILLSEATQIMRHGSCFLCFLLAVIASKTGLSFYLKKKKKAVLLERPKSSWTSPLLHHSLPPCLPLPRSSLHPPPLVPLGAASTSAPLLMRTSRTRHHINLLTHTYLWSQTSKCSRCGQVPPLYSRRVGRMDLCYHNLSCKKGKRKGRGRKQSC